MQPSHFHSYLRDNSRDVWQYDVTPIKHTKLINRCKPAKKDAKEYGSCSNYSSRSKKEGCQTENAQKGGDIEGRRKNRNSRKECKGLRVNNLKLEVSRAQKEFVEFELMQSEEKAGRQTEERRLKEFGGLIREYKAMHEDNFSQQLVEGGCGRQSRRKGRMGTGKPNELEECKRGKMRVRREKRKGLRSTSVWFVNANPDAVW